MVLPNRQSQTEEMQPSTAVMEALSEEVGLVASSLGLGELPTTVVNEENRSLQEQLAAAQIRAARARDEVEKENDELDKLHKHVESLEAASSSAKHFLRARTEELEGERNLEKIVRMAASRNHNERDGAKEDLKKMTQQVKDLEESIRARGVMLDLLDEEFFSDLARIEEWSRDASEYHEHVRQLLKCKHEDEIRIKEMHLKMEKVKEKVNKQKRELDEGSTENKMAQLALDKTAEEFRQLHEERQAAMERWNEAAMVVRNRDQTIQELYEKINKAKAKVRKKSIQLQEEESFLVNEKGNIRELEGQIRDSERRCQRLSSEAEAKERQLEAEESRLVLEERETMKLGAEVAAGRARIKETRALRGRLQARVEFLQKVLAEAGQKRKQLEGSTTTAEEKVMELEVLLDKETRKRDSLQWELDRLRDHKFKREQELRVLAGEEEAARISIKGLRIEASNLTSRIRGKKEEFSKKEEVAVTLDYRISQLERELKELKGQVSKENRAEMKKELTALKDDLAQKSSDRRNLNHLCHKIEADVRKAGREIQNLEEEEKQLESKLEEATLVTDTSKKYHSKMEEKVEALLLEEKLLMVNEKKIREDLRVQSESSADLERRRLDEEARAAAHRTEAQAHLEAWQARQRHLQEDLRFIRSEVRDRREQCSKLESKYSVLVKSLGDAETEGKDTESDQAPSHAFHLVKLAQEKAELKEEAEELRRRLKREEEELVGMQVAAAAIKNSNDKFRATNLGHAARSEEEESEEIRELKGKVKERTDALEKIRNNIDAVEAEVKAREISLARNLQELESVQAVYEERCEELSQVTKEVKDQERKLLRAEKLTSRASREMKQSSSSSSGAAPGAEELERDMDLRAEKEAQRAALIRLREMAMADVSFSAACMAEMEALGVSAPVLSRMELQHAQQRAASSSSRRSASAPRRPQTMAAGAAAAAATEAKESPFYRSTTTSGGRRTRSRRRSSSSGASALASSPAAASMLVMDMSHVKQPAVVEGGGAGGQARIRAQIPPVQ